MNHLANTIKEMNRDISKETKAELDRVCQENNLTPIQALEYLLEVNTVYRKAESYKKTPEIIEEVIKENGTVSLNDVRERIQEVATRLKGESHLINDYMLDNFNKVKLSDFKPVEYLDLFNGIGQIKSHL
jgi:DNA integrity scanning protein DisA with diadenylate cyclase activity